MADIQTGAAEQKELRGETEPKPKVTSVCPLKPAWKAHPLGPKEFYLPEQAEEAVAVAMQMSRLGHAIAWDTTYESDGRFLRVAVIHYLTCSCAKPGGTSK